MDIGKYWHKLAVKMFKLAHGLIHFKLLSELIIILHLKSKSAEHVMAATQFNSSICFQLYKMEKTFLLERYEKLEIL